MDKTSKQKHIETLRDGIRQLEGKANVATELFGLRTALAVLEGKPLPKAEHASSSKHSTPRADHSNDPRLRAMAEVIKRGERERNGDLSGGVVTLSVGNMQYAGVPAGWRPGR